MKISKLFTSLSFLTLLLTSSVGSQVPNQSQQLRIQIWSELDPFPGSFGDMEEDTAETDDGKLSVAEFLENAGNKTAPATQDKQEATRVKLYSFAISRAKEITPFFLSGMISGWTFDYTPYDKARGVAEFFEFDEVTPFDMAMNPIEYKDPLPENEKLLVWAYCDRTEVQQLSYRRWSSINLPKVRGRGSASVEKGFAGIQEATGNAIKNAVREYWRIYSKNKPKEITGRVLLIGVPRVYIYEGQYVTDLEFFLETDRIVKYTYF